MEDNYVQIKMQSKAHDNKKKLQNRITQIFCVVNLYI